MKEKQRFVRERLPDQIETLSDGDAPLSRRVALGDGVKQDCPVNVLAASDAPSKISGAFSLSTSGARRIGHVPRWTG